MPKLNEEAQMREAGTLAQPDAFATLVAERILESLRRFGLEPAAIGGKELEDALASPEQLLTIRHVGFVAEFLDVDPDRWMSRPYADSRRSRAARERARAINSSGS